MLLGKLEFDPSIVERYLRLLISSFEIVKPSNDLEIVEGQEADNAIVAAAIEAEVDYLVSGDRQHVLPLVKIDDVQIVTATYFLKVLNQR